MTHSCVIKGICFVFLMVIIVISNTSQAFAKADIEMTLKVIDEDGAPIEHGKVEMGYLVRLNWSSETISAVGYTDSNGNYFARSNADDLSWYTISKEGYYQSGGQYKFKEVRNGRWEPWNPEIRVVLRKKISPVPMYARSAQLYPITIPVINKEVGFDLIKYDWVSPYGQGDKKDMIFKLEGTYISDRDYDMTLTISFLGKFDGIQTIKEDLSYGSYLKLPRNAPLSGYQKSIVKRVKWKPQKAAEYNFEDDNNYIIRVRSEEKDGRLIKAMYGKILGELKFFPKSADSALLVFKYFLNPDYTRNLEYGENLFKNITELERP